jgi:hypothetical protein
MLLRSWETFLYTLKAGHRGTRPHPPLGVLAGVGDLPLAAHQDPFGSGGAAENDVLVAGL